jgi:hypothetical protein
VMNNNDNRNAESAKESNQNVDSAKENNNGGDRGQPPTEPPSEPPPAVRPGRESGIEFLGEAASAPPAWGIFPRIALELLEYSRSQAGANGIKDLNSSYYSANWPTR